MQMQVDMSSHFQLITFAVHVIVLELLSKPRNHIIHSVNQ